MFFPLIWRSNPSGSFTWKLSGVSGRGSSPRRRSDHPSRRDEVWKALVRKRASLAGLRHDPVGGALPHPAASSYLERLQTGPRECSRFVTGAVSGRFRRWYESTAGLDSRASRYWMINGRTCLVARRGAKGWLLFPSRRRGSGAGASSFRRSGTRVLVYSC